MIKYRQGDLFSYVTTDAIDCTNTHIIAHICNNIGKWGAGFTQALDKIWDRPRRTYYAEQQYNLPCSTFITAVNTCKTIFVANMIAQKGVRSKTNPKPIQYDWLELCLQSLEYQITFKNNSIVYMPRIGTGLGGGDWNIIEQLIEQHITHPVIVCTL